MYLTATIYALIDPISNQIKYVGQTTKTLNQRLNEHIRGKTNKAKTKWINHLISNGKLPTISKLETTLKYERHIKEQYWINYFTSKGLQLFNEKETIDNPLKKINTHKLHKLAKNNLINDTMLKIINLLMDNRAYSKKEITTSLQLSTNIQKELTFLLNHSFLECIKLKHKMNLYKINLDYFSN